MIKISNKLAYTCTDHIEHKQMYVNARFGQFSLSIQFLVS